VPLNIYDDFRKIGIHVFRRELKNSGISGIYINHPKAGNCIPVNYLEDVYRQRFTAAHEAAHAIFDSEENVLVSFTTWETKNLVEIRANTFASHYLMPPEFLRNIPDVSNWNTEKAIAWANKLKVSTEALAYALIGANLIDKPTENNIKSVRVPAELKIDPELPDSLSARGFELKKTLLKKGLSSRYVSMCFEAHRENIISAGRVAEMLLIDESDLLNIAKIYGEELSHGS
jgi:Zn-dependent peptidase ImmA (M78 family)